MAVFTPVEQGELERWLTRFDVGRVCQFRGISAGIENSNFFVTTESGAYVLTLFERLSSAELPFYLELMRHLAARGIPCPCPIAARNQELLGELNGKPAALVTRLDGAFVSEPTEAQCAQAGRTMAQMHLAARDFPIEQPNLRGLAWWKKTVPEVAPTLDTATRSLLEDELETQLKHLAPLQNTLPRGPIHADLFSDNALFVGDTLCGFIDFYFAGCDLWLFDVAVSINDWCVKQSTGELILPRLQAFLAAYAKIRPFTDQERAAWPLMLRAAALRFWLSRLWDLVRPRVAHMLVPHDPTPFERILRERRQIHRDPLYALPD